MLILEVSGNVNDNKAAKIATPPIMTFGSQGIKFCTAITKGAKIPPNRAAVEHSPIPLLLKSRTNELGRTDRLVGVEDKTTLLMQEV